MTMERGLYKRKEAKKKQSKLNRKEARNSTMRAILHDVGYIPYWPLAFTQGTLKNSSKENKELIWEWNILIGT